MPRVDTAGTEDSYSLVGAPPADWQGSTPDGGIPTAGSCTTCPALTACIWLDPKEPITDSDHKRRVEEARSEAAPFAELAEVLVERHDGWTEDDLQANEDDDEPVVSDKA